MQENREALWKHGAHEEPKCMLEEVFFNMLVSPHAT